MWEGSCSCGGLWIVGGGWFNAGLTEDLEGEVVTDDVAEKVKGLGKCILCIYICRYLYIYNIYIHIYIYQPFV